jgi:hypothetical protein
MGFYLTGKNTSVKFHKRPSGIYKSFKGGTMSHFKRIVLFVTMVIFIFACTLVPALTTAQTTPPPALLPIVPGDTTKVALTHIDIPPIKGKTLDSDLLELDQANHRLYLADRATNGVDVFDISTPTAQYLLTIDTGSGPNGVILAQNVKKLFAGLNDSTVAIIDIDPASP